MKNVPLLFLRVVHLSQTVSVIEHDRLIGQGSQLGDRLAQPEATHVIVEGERFICCAHSILEYEYAAILERKYFLKSF